MSTKVIISEEKQFMYRDSYNKGHIQTPSMIESCIGLSNNAKTVYSNILHHVYEKGQYAFPSVYRLAMASSCSVNSVVNYINELHDKGFIIKECRGRGRSNHYHIKELQEISLLRVSEMFWKTSSKLTNLYHWKQLYPAKDNIVNYIEETGIKLQDLRTDPQAEQQLLEIFKHVLKGGQLDMGKFVGLVPRGMKHQKPINTTQESPQPSPASKSTNIRVMSQNNLGSSVGQDKSHWGLLDVDEWKVKQFKEFYYDKYLDKLQQPHSRNDKKHTGQLRRVFSQVNDPSLLKKYMEISFEIGYDNMTLDYFCSSTRIGEIQTYLNTGKKPFYLEAKEPKKRDLESGLVKHTETISSDEMIKKMLGGRD